MATGKPEETHGTFKILGMKEIEEMKAKLKFTDKGMSAPDIIEELWVDPGSKDVWAFIYLNEHINILIASGQIQLNKHIIKDTTSKVDETMQHPLLDEQMKLKKYWMDKFCNSSLEVKFEALELCIQVLAEEIANENNKLNQKPFDKQEVSAFNIGNLNTGNWIDWKERAIKTFHAIREWLKRQQEIYRKK